MVAGGARNLLAQCMRRGFSATQTAATAVRRFHVTPPVAAPKEMAVRDALNSAMVGNAQRDMPLTCLRQLRACSADGGDVQGSHRLPYGRGGRRLPGVSGSDMLHADFLCETHC
eukprot:1514906-Rhodomonas_salina.1